VEHRGDDADAAGRQLVFVLVEQIRGLESHLASLCQDVQRWRNAERQGVSPGESRTMKSFN